MDIVFGDRRQVEIDDDGQLIDVQATGGHVGGHQHLHLGRFETGQRTQAVRLGLVAVDRIGAHALLQQGIHQQLDALARLDEDQYLAPALFLQQVQKQFRLAFLVAHDDRLLDGLDRAVARAHFHRDGILQHGFRHGADGVREGGREQQGLALLGHRHQQYIELALEAQVQHAVRLVQHQGLHLLELDGALRLQVQQAARRGHQYVETLAQFADLRLDGHAAVGDKAAQRQVAAIAAETGIDLLGQFARGHQHQHAHALRRHHAFQGQALQQRHGKAGRLARARLGGGHQVTAGQHGRNRLRLHGRGLGIAELIEFADQGIDQAEGGKRHGESNLGKGNGGAHGLAARAIAEIIGQRGCGPGISVRERHDQNFISRVARACGELGEMLLRTIVPLASV